LTADERPTVAQIHQAVGGNTLVMELLAKNVARFHGIRRQYSLQTLLHDLQRRGLLALAKSAPVKTDYQAKDQLRSETPEDIIAAMYDLGDLSRAEVALLSVFAVLPPESIPFDQMEGLLPDTPDLEDTALALAQRGWIDYNETDASFKCNPVVQVINCKKNPALRADCAALIDGLNEKLKRDVIHVDNYQQAAIAARYGEQVLTALPMPDLGLVVLCDGMGYYFQQVGNLGKALWVYDIQLDRIKKLSAADLENADWKHMLATTFGWLGTTHSALGNLPQALTFFEKDIELSKELHESHPQNVAFKNGLAVSYSKLGSTHTALGNLPQALTFFEERSRLGKELHESHPQNVAFKNGLATSYQFLGNTHSDLGNLPQALTFFEDQTKLFEELHESHPQNVEFKNNLAISYERLGDTHSALGNLPQALTFFEQYNQLEKELHESHPQNVAFKNGLAISYQFLGITHSALGNLPQALTFFEDQTKLFKELHESHPQNVEFKNGLAISYSKLGSTHSALGNLTEALTFFEQYNQLEKELHETYPDNVDFKSNFAEASCVLFAANKLLYPTLQTITIDKAIDLFEELAVQMPTPHYLKKLAISRQMKEPTADLKSLIAAMSAF
jgi:tetratricopeptide (TPR) repeat protein